MRSATHSLLLFAILTNGKPIVKFPYWVERRCWRWELGQRQANIVKYPLRVVRLAGGLVPWR